MEKEFTEASWVLEDGGIYRIECHTETNQKMLIQVFKLIEGIDVSASDREVVIMRNGNFITLSTRAPFAGYLIAK